MSTYSSRTRRATSGFIVPCRPTLATRPPPGPDWLHEIKHDGYRLMARRDGAGIRLITKNGHDWAERYPAVAMAVNLLPRCRSCLIDGEVVMCRRDGVAVFDLLRSGPQRKPDAFLYAFDLLELNGSDLRREPIEVRKAALADLLRSSGYGIRLNEHIEGDGDTVFQHACKLGCEGIVSKRKGSRYDSGPTPSRNWLKSKNPASEAARREAEEEWRR
jgi:bifunctional non-homologous end joining protein LigD